MIYISRVDFVLSIVKSDGNNIIRFHFFKTKNRKYIKFKGVNYLEPVRLSDSI